MALGASDARSQERLRNVADRDRQRVVHVEGQVARRAILIVLAGRRQNAGHNLVELFVARQFLAHPRAEEMRLDVGFFARLAAHQQHAPERRPMIRVFRLLQHFVDHASALGRSAFAIELDDVFGRRNFAGDVEVHAAKEGRVVAQRLGTNALFRQADFNHVIDGGGNVFDRRQAAEIGRAVGDLFRPFISLGFIAVFRTGGGNDWRGIGGGLDCVARIVQGLDARLQIRTDALVFAGRDRHEFFGLVQLAGRDAEIHADQRALGVVLNAVFGDRRKLFLRNLFPLDVEFIAFGHHRQHFVVGFDQLGFDVRTQRHPDGHLLAGF